jgi:hypothetical protein
LFSFITLSDGLALERIIVMTSGKKIKKLEDERNKVNELTEITGCTKYNVIGIAICSMYDRVMQSQQER